MTGADPERFIVANTGLASPSLVPEITLHLATDALPLWHKTEEELAEEGLPPPFWAFAWAGGQALARHLLDHPEAVGGKTVLDVGAGGGIVAVAAAMAGAGTVTANEVDPFALAAIALNAAENGVDVAVVSSDLLATDPAQDVILVGDLFYEKPLAERVLAFLRRARGRGATVLIGDPGRTYLPRKDLTQVSVHHVPVTRALEDTDIKRTVVWTLPSQQ
ncbi:MAG: 50S ribosomal protein L11 methyltransferase [Devosia sp.]